MSQSPCVKCPKEPICHNAKCYAYSGWFLAEWKKFNNYYEKHKDNQEVVEDGK